MSIDRGKGLHQVKTTCAYCGVGCGIIAQKGAEGEWQTIGDPDHPANYGRLCSKGSALSETLGHDGRLLYPEIDGERSSWDQATSEIAERFDKLSEIHGPQSIAFYLSGQMLTEDYYVANKLAKGFIGTPHVDTNSRLCMASSVAGHKRAFGSDTVPNNYEDLDLAQVIILVGSNAAWCHPVLFQRMIENRRRQGAKIVNIDIRNTATGSEADLAVTIRPGSDTYLFNGLLVDLLKNGKINNDYLRDHCTGFDEALSIALQTAPDAETTAEQCGCKVDEIEKFWGYFSDCEKVVTCYSQGVNQSSSGTDKVNAIINCHLATGRIGRPGSGPLSLTGQPNAMGGREVGGLANQLAAHMDFSPQSVDRVRRFWNAPNIVSGEGLKAVNMFDAIHDGRIRAVWIMCTNPAVSLPNTSRINQALKRAELVIVSDCVENTDTLDFAHIKLPAAAWGEKDGTVTNSERRISRQREFLAPPGEARPDWWAVCEVGRRLGFEDAFSFSNSAEIFQEHASLSSFENHGQRDFDLSGLTDLTEKAFNELQPTQWPVSQSGNQTPRLFQSGGFFHDDRKAKFIAVRPRPCIETTSKDYPVALNTGRVRDHWHTMTRTAKSPRLSLHRAEPFIELSEDDAEKTCVKDGGLAFVHSAQGRALLRVRILSDQMPGRAFAPIHWNRQTSACGGVSELIDGHCDPLSGQPESKHTAVSVKPAEIAYSGLILSKTARDAPAADYWSKWQSANCHILALGFISKPSNGWKNWLEMQMDRQEDDTIEYCDSSKGEYRAASLVDSQLRSAFVVRPGDELISSNVLEDYFTSPTLYDEQRQGLLSLKPLMGLAAKGPVICACFSVGLNEIQDLIISGQAVNPEQIGKCLGAGTNCGSCLPEIRSLISQTDQMVLEQIES